MESGGRWRVVDFIQMSRGRGAAMEIGMCGVFCYRLKLMVLMEINMVEAFLFVV
jgi:hypothetical protein